MPTGYTDAIKNDITFNDFILNCSRAFGALISMRDEPSDAPIPNEILPSDYHLMELKHYENELALINKMSHSDAEKRCKQEFKDSLKNYIESNDKRLTLRSKYTAMLDSVNKWLPPTSDHQGLKDFMLQQITDSISWDCGYELFPPEEITSMEWLSNKKESIKKSIVYHKKAYAEEVKRCKDRTKWIQELVRSLKN